MTQQRMQQEFLRDIDKNGKERDWKGRKKKSIQLAEAFNCCEIGQLMDVGYSAEDAAELVGELERAYISTVWSRKSERTGKCADILEFLIKENGERKLYRAWFCKDRLCPLCNWRRAMKFAVQIGQILQVMQERGITGRPIFLTLTMKNVKGEDIGKSFSDYAQSFNRLMKYKVVKDWCIGAIRASEVTYNCKNDTYNTHIHCLLWMKTSYFKRAGVYLSQAEWTELWKKAARLDYTPVVNVKAVKPKQPTEKDPTGLFSAVLEVSKYPIKPDAFQEFTTKVWNETPEQEQRRLKPIRELEMGMRSKRLISFFGIFKEIRAELKQDDIEEGDLVNAEEDAEGGEVVSVDWFEFNRVLGEYCKGGTRPLSAGERVRDWHST